MSELGQEFAARRRREFFNEKHKELLQMMDQKIDALEQAMSTDDLELVDKKLAEYKAFIAEMKFTNPSMPEEFEDIKLLREAEELTRKLHENKN